MQAEQKANAAEPAEAVTASMASATIQRRCYLASQSFRDKTRMAIMLGGNAANVFPARRRGRRVDRGIHREVCR